MIFRCNPLLIVFFLFVGTASYGQQQQPTVPDSLSERVKAQQETINKMQSQIWLAIREINSLEERLKQTQHTNDSLEAFIKKDIEQLNTAINQNQESFNKKLNTQQKDYQSKDREHLRYMKILGAALGVLFILLIIGAILVYRRFVHDSLMIASGQDKKTDEWEFELENKISSLEARISEQLDKKISENNRLIKTDPEIIHQPALLIADEIQQLRNALSENTLNNKTTRKQGKRISKLLRKLKNQGYEVKSYNGKKLKKDFEGTIDDATDSPENLAGTRITLTLQPEVMLNDEVIQKAIVKLK